MKEKDKRARIVANSSELPPAKRTKKSKPTTRGRALKDVLNTCEDNENKKLSKPGVSGSVLSAQESNIGASKTGSTLSKKMEGVSCDNSDEDAACVTATVKLDSGENKKSHSVVKVMSKAPSPRWGHTLTMVDAGQAVLLGGQGDKHVFCKDSVWHLDLNNGSWKTLETMAETDKKPEARMGHTATYDPIVRSIYMYGGSKNLKWFNDVHILDTDKCKWQLIKADGKAPTRTYHSATLYRHEVWIFGGVYPRPQQEPDGCSNDFYVFSPVLENWYQPIIMGEKPTPRSGHSATKLEDRLVMFGGWDAPICFNDLHVFDLMLAEWSQPKTNGTPPSPRSWHASTALSGARVLIHGGYNGNDALDDSFIFNLDTLAWTKVNLEPKIKARTGHMSLCLPYKPDNHDKDEVLIFAGGDNEGTFFQDLVCVMIPRKSPSDTLRIEEI